ncbi:hypothetical protein KSP39_PZI000318 [Platanthera zijinensis]|uniref:Uncharacterized protein n=1 Tax=Platanthera zijinensis TaxID=2320716 RepID=A0AAP0GGA3_9ASPA
MEDLSPTSSNSLSAVEEEDEEFYERIEAPKFVDFTIPDRRPDDRAWFCARIGCDQNHEEVDPDELYRSFVLRVMAARSPNIRFQRALNKQSSRANTKCPQSAPSKSVKNAISRMSAMNSVPEKLAMAKLKRHPITSLRETLIQRKARAPTLVNEKAQTTPMNNCSQTKYLKEPTAVVDSKNKTMMKKLFLHTPMRKGVLDKTPCSEICSEMKKKVNIDSETKGTQQGSFAMSSEKCKGSSDASKRMNVTGSKNYCHKIRKEAVQNEWRNVGIGVGENNIVLVGSDLVGLIKPSKHEVQYTNLNSSNGVVNEIKIASDVTNDDDKENIVFTCEKRSKVANSNTKRSQFETLENQTPEERGILKEANMERRLQVESKKEPPASLLKHVDGIQRLQPRNAKGKTIRRSQNKSFKIASPKRLLKMPSSAAKARREPTITGLNQDKRDLPINFPQLEQRVHVERNSSLRGRKPATVPKEPSFHKIHVRGLIYLEVMWFDGAVRKVADWCCLVGAVLVSGGGLSLACCLARPSSSGLRTSSGIRRVRQIDWTHILFQVTGCSLRGLEVVYAGLCGLVAVFGSPAMLVFATAWFDVRHGRLVVYLALSMMRPWRTGVGIRTVRIHGVNRQVGGRLSYRYGW